MKNFVDEKDFLPELKGTKGITVTTDYGRVDTTVPFVTTPLLHRLRDEKRINVKHVKGCTYQVSRK